MLAARLIAIGVKIPNIRRNLELGCNQAQQLCVRCLVGTKRPTGMAQIAQLDTYTQPVVISAMLPDKGKIFSRESSYSEQRTVIARKCKQLFSFR
jgi:hypothetical protein